MPSKAKAPKTVRFAYKNIVYPPPATVAPPLSHSISTAPSSSGPITPPTPSHLLPRPAPYGVPYAPSMPSRHYPSHVPSYVPQKAPSSTRHSGPARAHYYLEANGVVWDLADHPSSISRNQHHLSSRALCEPATEPPMGFITIKSPYLPWTFKVYASNGKFVTLEDVFDSIYRSLRTNITNPEFNSFPSEKDQRRATRAYEERYRRQRSTRLYEEEKRSGMKRVDFLMGRTRFVGISNNGRRPDEWYLNVT